MSESTSHSEVVAIYLTFPDATGAGATARNLVEKRLVACVNILPSARSVYRWDGAVVEESEVVAIAKSTRSRVPAVIAAVRETHPFEVPCIVAYRAVDGLPAYLEWVAEESSG